MLGMRNVTVAEGVLICLRSDGTLNLISMNWS